MSKRKGPSSHLQRQRLLRSCAHYFPGENHDEHDAVGSALLSVSSFLNDGTVGNDSAPDDEVDQPCATSLRTFSNTKVPMSIQEALERVAVWKVHSTRIAHAIESTAALAQILHRESMPSPHNATTGAQITTMELRHAYACAVLRAVNGLADTLQQQRSSAASVAVLCTELGVPPWLVAIRHEATHNQLPPLVTLRMAAHALLQYFSTVYWKPMARRRQQAVQKARELWLKYDAVVMSEETSARKRQKQSNEQAVIDVTIVKGNGSHCSTSDDEAPLQSVDGLWQSAPGTTSNRFSLLIDDTKRKAAVPVANQNRPPSTSQTRAKRSKSPKPPGSADVTCAAFGLAQQYVDLGLPMDVAYRAALDYLLGNHTTACGPMVSCDYDDTVECLRPMLTVLGRTWPGFVSALLTECVNAVCSMAADVEEGSMPDGGDQGTAKRLELWIRHLLSRQFLSKVYHGKPKLDGTVHGRIDGSIAPLYVLKALQFPLHRLCDCLDANVEPERPFVKRLSDFFRGILGSQRESVGPHAARVDARVEPIREHVPTTPVEATTHMIDSSLSLEDMEAMLLPGDSDNKQKGNATNEAVNQETTGTPLHGPARWTRCQVWEPCALGSRL